MNTKKLAIPFQTGEVKFQTSVFKLRGADVELKQVKSMIGKIVYYDSHQLNMSGNSINEYILSGCILRKKSNGKFYYQAELKELNINSLIIVPLEKVKTTKN